MCITQCLSTGGRFKFFSSLFDAIFPETCSGCGQSDTTLCWDCIGRLEPAEPNDDLNIWSAYFYHSPALKEALHRLKYKHKKLVAENLGKALYDNSLDLIAERRIVWGLKETDTIPVIPIPITAKRQRVRGYNQAELISMSFCQAGGNSFSVLNNVLYKIRETPPQARVPDRKTRLKNLAGSFGTQNTELVKNRCVILLDDVTTTGATIQECRTALLRSGAKEVLALTLAH